MRRLASAGRPRRLALGVAMFAAGAIGLALAGKLPLPGGSSRAIALPGEGEPTPQTDAAVPALNVTMIGASPLEASAETWGIGRANRGSGTPAWVLVRYTEAGWSLGPDLLDSSGQPLSGFVPVHSPLAGQMTADGSGALLGTAPSAGQPGESSRVLLVRNPSGVFQETAPLPAPEEAEGALVKPGEILFGAHRAPLLATVGESSSRAGAFVVPVSEQAEGVEDGVLHWDGQEWTREPIEIPPAGKEDFRVLAIGASSPANAWLLAQLSSEAYPPGSVALFRRSSGSGGASWQPVALAGGAAPGEAHPLAAPLAGSTLSAPFRLANEGEPPTVQAQALTVTGEGVWIDGERGDAKTSTTLYFKPEAFQPEGEDWGRVVASWCQPQAGAPACDHELPEALPSGPSRSLAWSDPGNPAGFGQRVITGFPGGVSLRLDGASFTRVLALGGGEPPNDVGGTFGAAFASPREGWLGDERLPVHLTVHPAPSRVSAYPVSFRHTLVAIAPQPGAPAGALSSEALAVGDLGEVARYEPGKGWMPESLLTSGGRRATPRLRSVAWPSVSRAYAVGDLGQMWLWRGETGLWEPDPATPLNFRGNLLGVAFDPNNSSRGYAVGQGGVLLRYGKTWTQEALPPGLAGANFTSVAFAGSEAIAAYRQLPDPSTNRYTGGLLVNNGSGWQIDQQAAAAMQSNVPWAVAGLPDGGAAFATGESSGQGAGAAVFERQSAGAPWQQTPTPLPGFAQPGSLALFREGGTLRAIASGSVPNTFLLEDKPAPPPGFPPNLIPPYPLNAGSGFLLRQTAAGWRDEQHEGNDVEQPPGTYSFYDMVYEPDPISAVLIDPTGTQGWAIGGFVDTANSNGVLDTADVARYPADGAAPPGVGGSAVPTDPTQATFAIGGNSQCAAPCADLANARIGPDTWLSAALSRAGRTPGVRAFLYTGPRVTTGATVGPATQAVPYARELGRYAQVLASSPIPVFATASPTDLDPGSECAFAQAFSAFAEPFGHGPAGAGLLPSGRSGEPCTAGSQAAYYAMDSTGSAGTVRVIVLDDSTGVGPGQRAWLAGELAAARGGGEPAIVFGDSDLNARIAAGDGAAAEAAQTIVAGGASAYFYDAPEQNVTRTLRAGGASIPAFGSGSLGYVNHTAESSGAFLGASGFLLAQVNVAARNRVTNRAPVSARLIPNIGELALEAQDGTLLRRSQVATFDALARRPRAGNRSQNAPIAPETDPYIPIPANCVGTPCASGLFPEYTFSSSRPDIGDFVAPNLASGDPNAVLLGLNDKPIPDPKSGLFCAYNAGTTIVTISAGGLSSSLPVTVQAGSVRRPCGTQPLKDVAAGQQATPVAAPPAPAPAPGGPAPASAPPPVVPVPPVPAPTPAHPPHPTPTPFFVAAAPPASLPAFVPLPVPTPARPTPPSGTSPVTSPVEAAEKEEEEEEATESVSNSAAAYHAPDHEPSPAYILGIVVLAAFAGASLRRRPRRGGRDVRVAPATISTMRAQRRVGSRRRWL
jgi:hypothetical protein